MDALCGKRVRRIKNVSTRTVGRQPEGVRCPLPASNQQQRTLGEEAATPEVYEDVGEAPVENLPSASNPSSPVETFWQVDATWGT
eukprot:scaffold1941_cov377-Prasinococcus_capsulatus_cf.AAC.3